MINVETLRKRRGALGALLGGLALVVIGTGCGAFHTPRQQQQRQVAVPAAPATALQKVETIDGMGARLEPAGRGQVPKVSLDEALSVLVTNGFSNTTLVRDRQPSKMLLVRYENMFGTQHPDGTETPSVPKQLAWFAEYDHIVQIEGGSLPAGATGPPVRWDCTYYVALSASSGKALDGFEFCK